MMRTLRPIRLLLACLLLAGCGSRGGRPEIPGKTVVLFWHAMGGPLGKVLTRMVDEFNAGSIDVHVQAISMGNYETLQKKILASVVARQSPDISQNFEALTVRLKRAGKLVCLDDLMGTEAETIKADIIPVLLANNTYDGKVWSFPFNKSVPVLYYNRELFADAGLDPNQPPRTVAELMACAARLTRDTDGDGRTDIYGYGFKQQDVWIFENRLLQFGGRIVEPGYQAVNYSTPPGIRALSFYIDMLRAGHAVNAPDFESQNDFIAGKVAMIEGSIVSRVYMQDKIHFDWGIAPVPVGPESAVVISGTNINIFDNGNPDRIQASWKFIRWFTSTEQGARWSLDTTYLPVRLSSLQTDSMRLALEEDPNRAAPYIQIDYATFEPRMTAWYECRARLGTALEQCFIEICDPSETLSRIDIELTDILQSAEDY